MEKQVNLGQNLLDIWSILEPGYRFSNLNGSKILISKMSVQNQITAEIAGFFVTQILCEIKVGESRYSKSAVLLHLEALEAVIYQLNKFRAHKMAVLEFPHFPKLISHTIYVNDLN